MPEKGEEPLPDIGDQGPDGPRTGESAFRLAKNSSKTTSGCRRYQEATIPSNYGRNIAGNSAMAHPRHERDGMELLNQTLGRIAGSGQEAISYLFNRDPKACITAIATIDAAGG
jgi:hypothetical protein